MPSQSDKKRMKKYRNRKKIKQTIIIKRVNLDNQEYESYFP